MADGFQNKTVMVTGAGSGIGQALAEEFAKRGALVYATDITLKQAQVTAKKIQLAGGTAQAYKCDVTKDADLKRVMNKIVKEHGQLDVMVNNAGTVYVGEFVEMTEAQIRKTTDINYNAVQIGMLYAYRQMKKQGFGQILNIASMGGLLPTATMVSYAGTKYGVVGLTVSAAVEAEAYGVDIRAACPGNIQSNLLVNAATSTGKPSPILDFLPKAQPANIAAQIIINGLLTKDRLIFTPLYARIAWYIHRLLPKLLHKGSKDLIDKYRNI